ncbi:MAG: M48 family metallopeptidase [Parvularculaceae bacterium]
MPNFPFIRHAAGAALAACALAGLSSCAYNEELGRSQLAIIPASQMSSLGATAWADVNKKEKVSTDPKYVSRLNRVAPKILRAAGENPRNWDYRVFDSKQLNAFALPGNHFAVYTGLMDLMANDDQLATVIGHEVGHVRANHGGERVSQQLREPDSRSVRRSTGDQRGKPDRPATQRWRRRSNRRASSRSRKHELEADRLGVIYMNRAGYDPNEGVEILDENERGGRRKTAGIRIDPSVGRNAHPGR